MGRDERLEPTPRHLERRGTLQERNAGLSVSVMMMMMMSRTDGLVL